jgi:3-oxoadipyl-CoA thiolase
MNETLQDVLIVDAVRTPVGRYGGALAGIRPDDLAAAAVGATVERSGVDPARIDEVYLGNANGAGEENRNVARMAALLAGLPTTVPGATVNRLCGSGLEAVFSGSRAIAVGDIEVAVAGGVESMSRAPWVMLKPEQAFERRDATLHSTTLGWRMVNPRMPDEWTVSLGEGAELLADRYGITREESDTFALASHRRAQAAWEEGRFSGEVVTGEVAGSTLPDRDEGIRADTSLEKLASLRPVFRADGQVTAGNASPTNDGAAAVTLASAEVAEREGMTPLARIVSRATTALEPPLYGLGPVEASRQALAKAGIDAGEIDLVELNEAFAAQTLACLRELKELDPDRVNVNGGAIALGHPLGCSGVRILTTLVHELARRGGRYGLATMCIGVGQGIAVVVERV